MTSKFQIKEERYIIFTITPFFSSIMYFGPEIVSFEDRVIIEA